LSPLLCNAYLHQLDRAWEDVRRNRGAAGIDRVSLADVEEYGVSRLLGELAAELREGRYRPLPARRVFIPKPGTTEQRPLSIPAVRDRVVQAAAKIVLEPVFEAGFAPCSFGFRPGRSAHDALQVLIDESWQGRRWVVETDIANCFSAIPHDRLMQAIEERVCDRAVLALIRTLLRAGVMEGGSLRRSASGTPQGGPLSPLLCNAYLHQLDRVWQAGEHGVLVRYVDDAVVMCGTREQAEAALARLTVLLAGLGLEPKAAKTRIVHLAEGNPGFDFLGFHHRLVRGRTPKSAHLTFLARWPSRKAIQHARDRIRENHRPATAAGPSRGHRHGTEPVPARLGRVLPLRQLGPRPRPDQELRPGTAGDLAVQERQPAPRLGMGHQTGAAVPRPPGPDHPRQNRHPAQALPALAGKTLNAPGEERR